MFSTYRSMREVSSGIPLADITRFKPTVVREDSFIGVQDQDSCNNQSSQKVHECKVLLVDEKQIPGIGDLDFNGRNWQTHHAALF
jgi:hypothetical protein